MAPDFDTFIWGWGGDPYDPGMLLNLLTTSAIGGSSDSFYSNPEYDRLYDAAGAASSTSGRARRSSSRWSRSASATCPYLVLTVDPILQAYRTDRRGGVKRSCPKPDGDMFCDQVSYAPLLNSRPRRRGRRGHERRATTAARAALLFVLIVVVVRRARCSARLIVSGGARADREALEV